MEQSDAKLRFTNLRLKNWRNFVSAEFALQQRAFIVGPNASGKSNLLDVFRFLRDLTAEVGGGLQGAVAASERGGLPKLRALSARSPSHIVIHVHVGTDEEPGSWEYELHLQQEERGKHRPLVRKEIVRKKGVDKPLCNRPDSHDKEDQERLTQTWIEQVTANKEARELVDFFRSIRYLHLVPQLVRYPERYTPKEQKFDPFGSDFLEQVARTPEKTRKARLKKISQALSKAVPQLRTLRFQPDTAIGRPHLEGLYSHWRPKDAKQNETQFSDGTIRLLGLLWALLDTGGGPLLLEEPELSLHPFVVRSLPQLIARMQRQSQRQVLISTHSVDLFREEGIDFGEILALKPGNNGSEVHTAATVGDLRLLLETDNMDDVLMSYTKPENVEQIGIFPDYPDTDDTEEDS